MGYDDVTLANFNKEFPLFAEFVFKKNFFNNLISSLPIVIMGQRVYKERHK